MLKTWRPAVVSPTGDDSSAFTEEFVLTAPRSFDGESFLLVSEDRTISLYAAER